MSIFDTVVPHLDIPLEQRLKMLEDGRGPIQVTQDEAKVIATKHPHYLTKQWRVQRALQLGMTGDYRPFFVEIVPARDAVGKHETKVLRSWEARLRELERQVVAAGEETRKAREKLYAALVKLAEARARARRRSGVTDDGQPVVPPDDPRIAELQAEVSMREADVEACEADEERAMRAYTTACQRFETERLVARNRDKVAAGEITS